MRQSPRQGDNRTGIVASGGFGEEMLAATEEFGLSSQGSAQAIADVRIAYAKESEGLGETPAPTSLKDKAKAAVNAVAGGQPTLLMDKLGERLGFEHAGARLYEALVSKHKAYGSFAGGPSMEDLLHILTEEYEHADVLKQAIKELGGDPTTLTPSANLAANISAGLPQVLSDPRTNLLQCLEAIMVAELADNECWTMLAELAEQGGHDELVLECQQAIGHERDHLRKVRRWIAAGQGREVDASDETDGSEEEDDQTESFTFTDTSAVDREGYAVSEEEAAEGSEPRQAKPASSSKRRAPLRGQRRS
jgi:rubrerythrin